MRVLRPADESAPLPVGFDAPGYEPGGEAAALGRGGARSLVWPDGRRVYYREYRHGGLFGGILGSRYLTSRILEREIDDTQRLRAHGVAVPKVVAGRIERRGAFCRMALVTERIDGEPLRSVSAARLRRVLRPVGRACASMHAAGFRHKDLHPGNVVVTPSNGVVILDLEGGRWDGSKGDARALRSLVRMARYVEKHDGAPPPMRVVLGLLAGYESERSLRHTMFRKLSDLYVRSVRRHRVLWKSS